jgi:hypothetical protein
VRDLALHLALAAAVLTLCVVLRPPTELEAPRGTQTAVATALVLLAATVPSAYLMIRFASRGRWARWVAASVVGLIALTAALRDYQQRRDAYSVEAEGRRFIVGLDSELTDLGRGYRESAPRTSRVDLVRAAAGRPRLVWDEAALRDHANTLERTYLFAAALAAVAAVTLAGAARSRARGASDLPAPPPAAQPDDPGSVPHRRFRVALSFPGEVRDRAERLAELLEPALGRDRIFFDRWYAAELARPDMDLYLQTIYRSHAELLVVILCADYQRKEWCGLEWRVVRDLIKGRESGRIMFLRLDAVSIDGLLSIDGYLDIAEMDDEAVAAAVLSRTTAPDATRSTLK